MQRRHLLQALVAGAGALARRAAAAPSAAVNEVAAAFEARRAAQPWTLGYVGLQDDVAPMPLTLRGRLPVGLSPVRTACCRSTR